MIIVDDHLVLNMCGFRSVILNLSCTGSVGQGFGDVENQRNEDSEGLFVTSTFGGGVQIDLIRLWEWG